MIYDVLCKKATKYYYMQIANQAEFHQQAFNISYACIKYNIVYFKTVDVLTNCL